MAIQRGANQLQWRVHLAATPEVVFGILSSDRGRESFWAETSAASAGAFVLTFPDRSTTTVPVLSQRPPHLLEILYFGAPTRFALQPAGEQACVLEVTASDVPADDLLELGAGWVSVLLNLKATINFGKDLRNHERGRTWMNGFIDN